MATEAQLDAVRQRANQEALDAIDQANAEEELYSETADDSENSEASDASRADKDKARDLFIL